MRSLLALHTRNRLKTSKILRPGQYFVRCYDISNLKLRTSKDTQEDRTQGIPCWVMIGDLERLVKICKANYMTLGSVPYWTLSVIQDPRPQLQKFTLVPLQLD